MLRSLARRALAAQPVPVQAAALNLWREFRMARAARHSSRQFEKLRGRRGLQVHLGCGPELKSGWINLDLNLNGTVPPIPPGFDLETMFILYDLRSGRLPLDDESCAIFYSSHFMEHLEYSEGVRLMSDCLRALRPGGRFRAGLPNFRNLFRAYLDNDHRYLDLVHLPTLFVDQPAEILTMVDHVNLGVYQWTEHKFIYDEEKICRVLRHIGYRSADIVPYSEGLDPGSELRQRYSFYVEAVK